MSIDSIIISQEKTINDALKQLNETARQILLVVDCNQQFLGTISDGDIRRALLAGKSLDNNLEDVAFKTPLTLTPKTNKAHVIQEARKRKITKIPVVSEQGLILDLHEIEPHESSYLKNNAAVIMAGGLGSRLKPLTNNLPKPLLPVANTPILERIIKHFCQHGYTRIYLAVNYKSEMIKSYFGDGRNFGADITYLEETERRGTAGALKLINTEEINEPFFVMNGDLLTSLNLEQMLNFHNNYEAMATLAVKEFDFQVPYGVIKSQDDMVYAIDEKPTYRFFVNAGIYILQPELLQLIPERPFVDMPELFNTLFEAQQRVVSFPIHEYWLDIGRMEDYQKANAQSHVLMESNE